MRNLFLLVLLLNVLLFTWQYTRPQHQEASLLVADPNVERLILLSELEVVAQTADDEAGSEEKASGEESGSADTYGSTQQEVAPDGADHEGRDVAEEPPAIISGQEQDIREEKLEASEKAMRCFGMGAFDSVEKARLAVNVLARAEVESTIERQVITEQRYWVILPTQPDLAVANAIVRELKGKGVKDLQVLTMEGKKNAISLGLYKVKAIAEARVKQIKKLGYEPSMDVIPRSRTVYWLTYHLIGDKPLSDKVIAEISTIQGVSREGRDCK